MAHSIAWFDMPAEDLQRAAEFYRKVPEVEIETCGPDVPVAVFGHGPEDVAGCLVVDEPFRPASHGPPLYFPAEGRVRQAAGLVEAHGGKLLEDV